MDDIMGMLESNDKPFKSESSEEKKDEKFDYWGDPDCKKRKINVNFFNKTGKSFTTCVYIAPRGTKVPDDVKTKFIELTKVLGAKGYTYRHTGDSKDDMQNAMLEVDDVKIESYIPWKKFNPDIISPTVYKPMGAAYEIAANSHKGYTKLPPSVRTILGRDVHAMLGKDLNNPVDFLIAYTLDGAEALSGGKKLDYAVTGNLAFYMKIAEESNIPVFNLKNDDAIKRLSELLSSTQSKPEGDTNG